MGEAHPELVEGLGGERSRVIEGFLNWNFKLFRIFGIEIRAHWFYPVIVLMYVLRGMMDLGTLGLAWYSALMAALFVTVLVHELGHCFMARRVGGHAEKILLWPLGGLAYVGHGGGPKSDMKVAAAGPMTHFPMAGICVGILFLLGAPWDWNYLNIFSSWYPFYPFEDYFWENFVLGVFRLQIIVFLFNMLVPAYPLDGGRILANFLLMRYSRSSAARTLTYFSIPIGIAILIWAFLQRELLFGFIGVWVLFEAWQIRRLLAWGEIDRHPMFASASGSEFESYGEEPAKPGFFKRLRAKRARKRLQREAERQDRLQVDVDRILEKVSTEGIQSLTPQEKKILDEASKRARGE